MAASSANSSLDGISRTLSIWFEKTYHGMDRGPYKERLSRERQGRVALPLAFGNHPVDHETASAGTVALRPQQATRKDCRGIDIQVHAIFAVPPPMSENWKEHPPKQMTKPGSIRRGVTRSQGHSSSSRWETALERADPVANGVELPGRITIYSKTKRPICALRPIIKGIE